MSGYKITKVHYWTEEEVEQRLEKVMVRSFDSIYETAQVRK
ncbi:hypothetical protein ACT7DA_08060 [Bacillus pacificus]